MHIFIRSILVLLISMALGANAADAQGRGGGGAPKTHPVKTVTHSSAPKTSTGPKSSPAPKTQGASHAPKTHGGGSAAHAPKTTTATAKGKPSTTTTATASNTKASKTPPTITPTATPTTVTLTPVQQKLQRNTNLAGKLESRLPKGTDLMLAADGFRNLGQFVAAVNVSNNLKIPFTELKTSMVDDGLSLGQSIKKLRPLSDATREASRGESQATVLLNSTTTTTSATTSTKTKKNTGTSQD